MRTFTHYVTLLQVLQDKGCRSATHFLTQPWHNETLTVKRLGDSLSKRMNATMNEGGARAEEMDNFGVVPSRYGTSPLSNHFFSVLAGPNKRDRCTSDESGTSFWFMPPERHSFRQNCVGDWS